MVDMRMKVPGWLGWLVLLLIWCAVVEGEKKVTMVFGGDVSFNGILEYMVNKDHCTYEESLCRLKPVFEDIDYVVVNLESVVYKEDEDSSRIYGVHGGGRTAASGGAHAIQDLSALKALKNAGVNTVSVANSHIGDYSVATEQLKEHDIKYFGLSNGGKKRSKQKPLILEKNGLKIGLLGYCATRDCHKEAKRNNVGAALFNSKEAVKQIKKMRKDGVNAVILFLNWGGKYKTVPSTRAILNIKKLITKVKVDLIVGSHPHVTHPHWIVNETLVASSLGNLLSPPYMTAALNFQQKYMKKTNKSLLPGYEKTWHKQMKIMDDPSRYGKLIKIEVDKLGIILQTAKFSRVHITSNQRECLITQQDVMDDSEKWLRVCGTSDLDCAGTYECNYIECDEKYPLPNKLGKLKKKKKSKKKKKKKGDKKKGKSEKKKGKSKPQIVPPRPPAPPPPPSPNDQGQDQGTYG